MLTCNLSGKAILFRFIQCSKKPFGLQKCRSCYFFSKPGNHGTAHSFCLPALRREGEGYLNNGGQMEKRQEETARLCVREMLLEKLKGFTLLSDVFLSVALRDQAACQHVLRLLTGKEDLTVREVRTQYRISKILSHDAILDVLAEDEEYDDGLHVVYVNAEVDDGFKLDLFFTGGCVAHIDYTKITAIAYPHTYFTIQPTKIIQIEDCPRHGTVEYSSQKIFVYLLGCFVFQATQVAERTGKDGMVVLVIA